MKEVKMGIGRMGVKCLEERRKRLFPGLLYADDLVLCNESEGDLNTMVLCFVEVCRRGLKVNTKKSKVKGLVGEEGSLCEVLVDGNWCRRRNILKFVNLFLR